MNRFGSFELALAGYRFILSYCRDELVQFQPIVLAGNWKTLRYAFGIALLDDGYFTPNITTRDNNRGSHRSFVVMDEFTAGRPWNGSGSSKWLGHPVATPLGAPPTRPYQKGVWVRGVRRGARGCQSPYHQALQRCSGRAKGAVTIALPPGKWRKFKGHQDPVHNDGRPCNGHLTIEPGDAYLLVRQEADPDHPG
ncbi:MAG: hypothetical protein D6800_06320 [Candidatus Zixiibacteriota bacterium]|nr:MAG: hypothetical protein D6800_06320 [candidate division Zixibacteria bacterium]